MRKIRNKRNFKRNHMMPFIFFVLYNRNDDDDSLIYFVNNNIFRWNVKSKKYFNPYHLREFSYQSLSFHLYLS